MPSLLGTALLIVAGLSGMILLAICCFLDVVEWTMKKAKQLWRSARKVITELLIKSIMACSGVFTILMLLSLYVSEVVFDIGDLATKKPWEKHRWQTKDMALIQVYIYYGCIVAKRLYYHLLGVKSTYLCARRIESIML